MRLFRLNSCRMSSDIPLFNGEGRFSLKPFSFEKCFVGMRLINKERFWGEMTIISTKSFE